MREFIYLNYCFLYSINSIPYWSDTCSALNDILFMGHNVKYRPFSVGNRRKVCRWLCKSRFVINRLIAIRFPAQNAPSQMRNMQKSKLLNQCRAEIGRPDSHMAI